MMISNVSGYMPTYPTNAYEDPHAPRPPAPAPEAAEYGPAAEYQRSSKVIISPDGETVMQYTTLAPSGAIMRKNVTLSPSGTANPSTVMDGVTDKRTAAYEGMMLYG